MPSPFPGMDPYLEHPAFFSGVHDGMITYLREALQPKLPEPYYAEMNDRLWVEVSERPVEPDIHVMRGEGPVGARGQGGAAVSEATGVQPVVIAVPHDEHREPYLEVFARTEGRERVVTAVEILSPSNKRPSEGRTLYRRKQEEILGGETHLVEIDLLRGGEHTTAVPRNTAVRKAGPFDYHVCVRHFDRFGEFVIDPIRLPNRLPEIAIPLLPGDGAVTVDLQAVLDRSYDTGPTPDASATRRSNSTRPSPPNNPPGPPKS